MKQFGMGIVGTGMIAAFHARAISQLPNARLVGVASRFLDSAQRFCAAHGGTPYGSLDDLLANPELDVLVVATPSGCHVDAVLAAACAGKHALCEKPLEISTERVDRMIAAHRHAGTRLGCIFQFRHLPAVRVIREAIRQGRLGTITYAGVYVPWWRDRGYYSDSVWHGTRELDGGGALMNQSIHMIDLLCDWMPPVRSVAAHVSSVGHPGIEVEDAATASLAFEGGAVGVVYGTTSAFPGQPKRIEVFGTDGSIVMTDNEISVFSFREERPEDVAIRSSLSAGSACATGAGRPDAMTEELHARCFADFLNAVETGRPFESDGESARRSVALLERIYGSAKTANDE
ncbi:MAG: Gfo/Idh/MocA family oxidoreductase [Kiritimatiellae bacterium]|nr:Gfo/Idh/MocA family oxidoreductase [Kiritimatiellia bacterium]